MYNLNGPLTESESLKKLSKPSHVPIKEKSGFHHDNAQNFSDGEFQKHISELRKQINQALNYYLPSINTPPKIIHEAMRYSVLGGGHRWRPILLLIVNEMFGGKPNKVMPMACVVELVHCGTLILDDLPCEDNAHLRHGKSACYKVYGEAHSIHAAFSLLSLCYEIIAKSIDIFEIDANIIRNIITEFAGVTGSYGILLGQTADLESKGKNISEEELLSMYRHKSGDLYAFSARMGALLVGAKESDITNIMKYAENLAMSYQIQDDIYDIEGAVEQQGKDIGQDINKPTSVSLYGLRKAKTQVTLFKNKALRYLESFKEKADTLKKVADCIVPVHES